MALLTDSAVPGAYPKPHHRHPTPFRRHLPRAYRRLRQLDDRQLELWRLATLAARLAEDIAEDRDDLVVRYRQGARRASPIDLLPGIGRPEDIVVAALVLRRVARRPGPRWPARTGPRTTTGSG